MSRRGQKLKEILGDPVDENMAQAIISQTAPPSGGTLAR